MPQPLCYNHTAMLTLAIETATEVGGLCLYDDEKGLLGELTLGPVVRHSQSLMVGVDFLLKQTGTNINDVGFFSVSIGPGSFTGLRVGLSTAKGLAYSTGRPIVEVPTLEAMALTRVPERRLICPLLDARKKEVYGAVFRYNGRGLERVLPEKVAPVEEVLKGIKEECVFLGPGSVLYRKRIIEHLGQRAEFVSPEQDYPLARTVALLGLTIAEKPESRKDPSEVVPFYIRPSEAELKMG